MTVDIRAAIAPKSNQLNAEDLLDRTMLLTITGAEPGTAEQRVRIHYQDERGKPWYPCKSMLRVMVKMWGEKPEKWIGQAVLVWNDPKVRYGGLAVGGIRILEATGISETLKMPLTETRGSRKLYTVEPLKDATPKRARTAEDWLTDLRAELGAVLTWDELQVIAARPDVLRAKDKLTGDLKTALEEMVNSAEERLTAADEAEQTEAEEQPDV